MGLFKKIKKAFKKVTGVASGGLLSDDGKPKAAEVAAPTGAAAIVEAPKDEVKEDDDTDTESARKAAKAKGKKNLSVSRASGSGVNI